MGIERDAWDTFFNFSLAKRESASDEEALENKAMYPKWKPGTAYAKDKRVLYNDTLYRVKTAHTSQADWTPDVATSLFEEISLEEGTITHPIPYNNNMELFEGKYYTQDDVLYLCTRSTGTTVYNPLAQLVGLYVEVVDE